MIARFTLIGLIALAGARSALPGDDARTKQGLELFRKSIRKVLAHQCLDCHGGRSVKGDFNLATRKSLIKSGYVGESAEDSHLVAVIEHVEEPQMPFKRKKLPQKSIQLIRKWIDLGAPYDKPLIDANGKLPSMQVTDQDRQFWSFRPLAPGPLPTVKNEEWVRTEIDHYILAKLDSLKLKPNNTASKHVLIRRAYFDLLGIPPTPEEVDAFVSSNDPEAWPKLIDRLLKSPHYGERWARHWMDIARFGESSGGEHDSDRPNAYHYRDALIKALNADVPHDTMIRWQLAGDELEPENPIAVMSTGFLSAGTFPTQLTETEFESTRYDELDDMVTTTGVAFLGLSIGCARCHDHKFDPIPTRDYYRFTSTFTKTIRCETELDLDPEGNAERKRAFARKLQEKKQELADFEQKVLPARFHEWLKSYEPTDSLSPWETLKVVSVESTAGTKFEQQSDGALLTKSPVPVKEIITVVAETRRKGIRAIRLEALTHDSFPRKGPGRAPNGNFALGDFRVIVQPLQNGDPVQVKLVGARATHQQNTQNLAVAKSIDNDSVSGWAVDQGGIGKDQAAVFDTADAVGFDQGTRLTIKLTLMHPNTQHTLGRFRLSVSTESQPKAEVGSKGPAQDIVDALAATKKNPEPGTDVWQKAIAWFAGSQPESQILKAAVSDLEKKGPQLKLAKAMIASEGLPKLKHHADGRGYPHFYPETYILKRGDPGQKQEVATPSFLQVLMPASRKAEAWKVARPEGWTRTTYQRASLANWITDTEHGAGQLAARVIVNRLWHHHFGRGIVASPNDFGAQGERPSHPKLLDWLAADLISRNWKLKRLHKLIMTSHVYMQSSERDEARAKIDRENTYLWRRTPKRLEAEAIRDAMLAVSGQLDRTMFGRGTLDANSKRRSVYFTVKRSRLVPMLQLFDWPEHLVSIGRRSTTTIAPQALMFMNSPQGRMYAEAFAAQLPTDRPDVAIRLGFRRAVSREPSDDEAALFSAFLKRQTAIYHDGGQPQPEQLALSDFCQTLMSMNEFVYLD